MLAITTSAKTLDFTTDYKSTLTTTPVFITEAEEVASTLKKMSLNQLKKTLDVSDKLAIRNFERYQSWNKNPDQTKVRPAIFAYKGDVYRQMHPETYTRSQALYAQQTLRIISGLYGLLHPYDLMQPYRLEMNAEFTIKQYNNLSSYWRKKATGEINKDAKQNKHSYLVNLASNEYSKIIDTTLLSLPMITIEFNQVRAGKQENIGLLSKRARGQMIEFMIKNQIDNLNDLKKFNTDSYKYVEERKNLLLFVKG